MQVSSVRRRVGKLAEPFNVLLVALFLMGIGLFHWFPSGLGHSFGETHRFGYRYSIEFPSSYPDILSFEHITSRVVVRIIAPPDMDAFADVDNTCVVSAGRYEYKRVFLPAQHIRIRWKPKPTNEGISA